MGSMFLFTDVLILGFGLYTLYGFYVMKTKGEVKENIMLTKDVKMSKCKDKGAYMAFMAPKLLIFGIIATLCGILGLLEDTFHIMGMGYMAVVVLFFIVIVWYAIMTRKGMKMFW